MGTSTMSIVNILTCGRTRQSIKQTVYSFGKQFHCEIYHQSSIFFSSNISQCSVGLSAEYRQEHKEGTMPRQEPYLMPVSE